MISSNVRRTAGITATTALVLLCGGCGSKGDPESVHTAPAATAVVVETAERREVPIMVDLVARTEAAATVDIRANVGGRLTEMSFQEGRMVEKGQILFRIDSRRYEAAVQAASAAVEKAQADLELAQEQQHLVNAQSALRQSEANLLKANQDAERMRPLAARRAVPERDLEAAIAAQSSAKAAVEDARATVKTTTVSDRMGLRQAQASLMGAKAARDSADLDREETVIRAPISGLIGRLEVSVGNEVGRGEPSRLTIISQVDPIKVLFNIPEALYLRTRVKGVDRSALDRIELILSDNSVYPSPGRFSSLGRAVDAKTGTVQVEAVFPNEKGTLLPGMFGRVRMAAETRPDAVLVSEKALFDVQGSRAVYIVTADKKVALRSVVTEGSFQGKSIITRGLGGGETVIVEGTLKVRPGSSVITQTAQARQDR